MKTLVLGHKGLLGNTLMHSLEGNVVGCDIDDIDVTIFEDVRALIKKHQPDVVINATAYNDVDGAEDEKNRILAEAINGRAPGYIAKAAKEFGATFFHFTSEMVFDGKRKKTYAEDDDPCAQNAYGETKIMGEQAIQDIGGDYYIIRTSRLYGKLPKDHKGKEPFIDLMIRLAKEKEELTGVEDESSCQTYIVDLVHFINGIIKDRPEPGIYHAVNTGAASWYEFAKEAFAINNIPITFKPVAGKEFPRPAYRAKHVELINTKRPQLRPWKEALNAYFTESQAD